MTFNDIFIGDNVIVTRRDGDDFVADEFMARVVDILDEERIIVEDQDSDFFTVTPEQLELNNE